MKRRTIVFIDLPGQGFQPAGMLEMDCRPGQVDAASFRYGSRYFDRPEAIPIDPINLPMPVKGGDGLHPPQDVARDSELISAIRDASPDGFGRLVLARAFGEAQLDEFEYLVASGTHRVGALAFGPDPRGAPKVLFPKGKTPPVDEINIDEAVSGYDALLREDYISEAFERFANQAGSLGGARPKAAVSLDGRQWLAKFSRPNDTYDAVRVEAGVMLMARAAGFNVPDVRVAKAGERMVFLIERFDRSTGPAGRIELRHPFLSAMSATGHSEMTSRYGAYEEIVDAFRKIGGAATGADLRELFRRAAYNVLTGNDDDHLRNHGFLYDHSRSIWKLSPLYDVAPRPQTSSLRKLALAMRTGDPDRPSTLSEIAAAAPVFGIAPEEGLAICDELRAFVAANWKRHMRDVGLAESEIVLISSCFAQAQEP